MKPMGKMLVIPVLVLVVFGLPAITTASSDRITAPERASELMTPQEVVDFALPELNGHWSAYFQREGLAYRPPPHYYWYNHAGMTGWWKVPVGCDIYGDKKDGYIWAGRSKKYTPNSFYCPGNKSIYLDHTLFTNLVNRDDGRAIVVVAHEFAHHVQYLLKWPVAERRAGKFAQFELHADCYAGIFFKWVLQRGLLEHNDLVHAARALGNFGDPDSTPWYEPGAHGGTSSREESFVYGYDEYDTGVCDSIF